jgi:hypothetical protein
VPLVARDSRDSSLGKPPSRPSVGPPGGTHFSSTSGDASTDIALPPPPARNTTTTIAEDDEEGNLDDEGDETWTKRTDADARKSLNLSIDETTALTTGMENVDLEAGSKRDEGDANNASNLPNKHGFTSVVKDRLEVPAEAISRLLMNDEKTCGEFDCYYPDWKTYSFSTHLNTTYKTLGLYLFYLLYRTIAYWLQSLCGIDPVSMNRGKMIVTDKGRLLFWQLKARQSRWSLLVDGRAAFTVGQAVRIMNIRDVRETTVLYNDMNAFCCCCNDSKVSLEVVFNSFPVDRDEYNDFFYTQPCGEFYDLVQRSTTVPNVKQSMFGRGSVASKTHATSSKSSTGEALVVRLVSKEGDECAQSENHGQEALERILALQGELSKHLELRDSFITDKEIIAAYKDTEELANFELVDKDGDVTIPKNYISLTDGEHIIASIGQQYVMSCTDMFLCCLSLGMYYCMHSLGQRQRQRTAHILTNKRIVEIFVEAQNGIVPVNMKNMKARIRSVFPGRVLSGFISYQAKAATHSALLTESGEIHLMLPIHSKSAIFAQSMQSVSSRTKTRLSVSEEDGIRPSSISGRLTASRNTTALRERWGLTPEKITGHVENLDLNSLEVMPLVPKEKVVHWMAGENMGSKGKDGGSIAITNRSIIRLHKAPMVEEQQQGNNDVFIKQGGEDQVNANSIWKHSFFIMWIPVADIIGNSTEIISQGAHPVSHCCSLCSCYAARDISDKFIYSFLTNRGIRLAVYGIRKIQDALCTCDNDGKQPCAGSWLMDEELINLQKLGGVIQTTNDEYAERLENWTG